MNQIMFNGNESDLDSSIGNLGQSVGNFGFVMILNPLIPLDGGEGEFQ
jgi:hypothetical protein